MNFRELFDGIYLDYLRNNNHMYFHSLIMKNHIKKLLFTQLNNYTKLSQESLAYELNLESEKIIYFTSGYRLNPKLDELLFDKLGISDKMIREHLDYALKNARIIYDKHTKILKDEGKEDILPFELTEKDFDMLEIVNKGLTESKLLEINFDTVYNYLEKLEDEWSNRYEKDNYDFTQNEAYFWNNLRQCSGLSFSDIQELSKNKFTIEQLSKLEYMYLKRTDKITLNRQEYFEFLKEHLIKVSDIYKVLSIDFTEYKFYVNNLLIDLEYKDKIMNPFSPYYINNKKYLATNLNFLIR